MKKILVFMLCVVIVIIVMFWTKYLDYKSEKNSIKEANLEYEVYLNKEIKGRELITAINRAINNNEINHIEKNEQGFYKKNEINSINIEIRILDNDTTYQMETLYNGGMSRFLQFYGDITFECKKINYNSIGKVNYILFEQKMV